MAVMDHLPAITASHCTTKEIKQFLLGSVVLAVQSGLLMGGEQKCMKMRVLNEREERSLWPHLIKSPPISHLEALCGFWFTRRVGSGHGGDGLGSDSVISKVFSNQRDSVIPWFSLIQHTLVGESICDDCSEASSCLLPSPSSL